MSMHISPRGVETSGATGALAPAMLKPRGREYLFAPAIFSHIPAIIPRNNIHTHANYSMLSSFFKLSKKIHIVTENINKRKNTHRPILPIRLAYVISKMANFYVCCDKQQ